MPLLIFVSVSTTDIIVTSIALSREDSIGTMHIYTPTEAYKLTRTKCPARDNCKKRRVRMVSCSVRPTCPIKQLARKLPSPLVEARYCRRDSKS